MTATIPESVFVELREMRVKLKHLPIKREESDAMLARVRELHHEYGHGPLLEAVETVMKEMP